MKNKMVVVGLLLLQIFKPGLQVHILEILDRCLGKFCLPEKDSSVISGYLSTAGFIVKVFVEVRQ